MTVMRLCWRTVCPDSIMCEVCAARTDMKSFLCRNAVHLGEELMKSVAELLKKKRHFLLGFTEPMPKRI